MLILALNMPITKFVILILKIFTLALVVSTGVFLIAVYTNTFLLNAVLPVTTKVSAFPFFAAIIYAFYTGLEFSLFFISFILLIIRLSIVSATIFTIRDIIQFYKKFIISSFIVIAVMVCALSVFFSNFSGNTRDIQNSFINGNIIPYALPCFWLILATVYYRNYQSKINEPDGCKDRSWLEGNTEK